MDKGIYTALSGGIAKSHELELLSNNLANSNTVGFKKDRGTFNEYLMELRRPDTVESLKREIDSQTLAEGRAVGDKSFVEMDGIYTNFAQGPIQKTNRNLDFALEGNGFFEVSTPFGVRYTRQGNFNLDAKGRLVTVNGYPVLSRNTGTRSDNRELKLSQGGDQRNDTVNETKSPTKDFGPESRAIYLLPQPFQVTEQGGVYQNGSEVARLAVEEFYETQWLEKAGNSYFKNDRLENLKLNFDTFTTKVHQGFLEGSNVNPVHEMTKLIEATRAYESHMQAIKTFQEIDGRTVNDFYR